MMAGNVKKEWFVLGLTLIILGLALVSLRGTTVYQDGYLSRGSLDNYHMYYDKGLSPQRSVSGNFTTGENFFFNFTKGRFWGVQYDINNKGLEPPNNDFAPNTTIPGYKTVDFLIHTPSGDTVWSIFYVVGGAEPFAVTYFNESADFVPLAGGNLTFVNTGMNATIERAGNYTVEAVSVDPSVHQDENHTYDITTDPPTAMNLYSVEKVGTTPYFMSSISAGAVLMAVGVVSSFLAARPKNKQKRVRSKKTRP
jgi:hypothetical protein